MSVPDFTAEPKSPLRQKLERVAADSGCSLGQLTVLAAQHDPYRLDTPARHRDGEWLARTARELGLGDRRIHLRGLHYMVIGRPKPDGTPYTNTERDWSWLVEDAGKAARWLGYLPFEQVVDERNAEPVTRILERPEPYAYLDLGLDIAIPSVDDMEPSVGVAGFAGVQPYKLVLFGEKSSLADILGELASRYGADLYLPTGEISDTLLYRMARIGAEDGRPMAVLCFSDCDPAGWQMPISIARKLQAFRTLEFHDLEFEVHRVALTPDQVQAYGLPSTPMKATERRADRWRAAMQVEQTEIDALASLNPRLLEKLAHEAVAAFFDETLEQRVACARAQWLDEAQEIVDERVSDDDREAFREQAAAKLEELAEQIEELSEALSVDVAYDELPAIDIPEPDLDGKVHGKPLLDSRWSFAEQCRALIRAKQYAGTDDPADALDVIEWGSS